MADWSWGGVGRGLLGLLGGGDKPYTELGQFKRAGMGKDGRLHQTNLANMLWAQAQGEGPSLANETLRQGIDAGVNSQQSMAATGRGNPALASRMAAQNSAGLVSGMAGQGAINRLMEQQAAQQGLAGVAGQLRGQDLNASQFDTQQHNLRQLEMYRGRNAWNQNANGQPSLGDYLMNAGSQGLAYAMQGSMAGKRGGS